MFSAMDGIFKQMRYLFAVQIFLFLFYACLTAYFFSFLFSVAAPWYLGSSIDTLFFKSGGALIVSMKP